MIAWSAALRLPRGDLNRDSSGRNSYLQRMLQLFVLRHHATGFFFSYQAVSDRSILTKNAAYSQRWHKIRVNGIMVGWMDTPAEDMIQRQYHGVQDNWLEAAESKQPLEKLAKPDEVAELVALGLHALGRS